MTSALRSVASERGLGHGSAIAWPLPSGVHDVDAVCTSHGFVAQSQIPALYGETCTSYEAAPGTGSHETMGVSVETPVASPGQSSTPFAESRMLRFATAARPPSYVIVNVCGSPFTSEYTVGVPALTPVESYGVTRQ